VADNEHHAPASAPARIQPFWLVSLAIVLVLVLAGGIWVLVRHAPPGGASIAARTPTATSAPPRAVYTADWVHSASDWKLPKVVHLQNGVLVFAGTSDVKLTIPYQPPVSNYTINVTMEVDSVGPSVRGGTITIEGLDSTGKSQYYAQLLCAGHGALGCNGGQYTLGVFSGKYPDGMQFSDFSIGPYEIPFKLQVAGKHVVFCKDTDCESVGFVSVPTTPLKLVIDDDYLVMKIQSVSVTEP
jgi:hypothetical protein